MTNPGFQHIAVHDKITESIESLTKICSKAVQVAEAQATRIEILGHRIQQLESTVEFLVGKLERPL